MKRVRESDPERLELSDPALKRALSSLSDDGPSAAELQRMRQRLMGVVEAPASSRAPLLDLVRSPIGALLIGLGLAAAIGLVRYKQERDAAREVSTVSALAPRASDEALAPAESPPATARVDSPLVAASDGADQRVASPEPAHASAVQPLRTRPRHAASSHALSSSTAHELAAPSGEASAPTGSAHGSRETPAIGAEPTSVPDAPVVTPSASSKVAKASAPSSGAVVRSSEAARASSASSAPSPTPVRAEAPAPLDEAALLQRARQLAASEPEASLRLLNEHKQRFSHGMLTPEREVLAIELLRSLSRRGEAARRLDEFQRNFPNSVYLQRLVEP